MKRAALLAGVFFALASPAQAADGCHRSGSGATVIVLWGPGGAEEHCDWFARRGFRTRGMPPLPEDWRLAWRRMLRVIRDTPAPRFVYGWSRAGTIAELLALRGKVDGALAISAPSDLTRWWNEFPDYWRDAGWTMEDRRARSPLFNVPAEPVRLFLAHSPADRAVPFWHSRKLHRRAKGSRLVRLTGDHNDDIRGARRAALRFIARACGTGLCEKR